MDYYIILESLFKLFLALVLGGIIGGERENKCRPAGLRTHMLVCIGASLIQITSINYYATYVGNLNVDPMRLGAQVISGIGFLGAGAILKEGVNVKGLTTAATIWVVGCLGLTIGAGLYIESILGTIFMYIALRFFFSFEARLSRGNRVYYIEVIAHNIPGKIGEIGTELGKCGIDIFNVELRDIENEYCTMEFIVRSKEEFNHAKIIEHVAQLKGIKDIKFM